jgi:hypothetical protein
MSSITRICPSQAGEPPIPIVGTATAAVSEPDGIDQRARQHREAQPESVGERADRGVRYAPDDILHRDGEGEACRRHREIARNRGQKQAQALPQAHAEAEEHRCSDQDPSSVGAASCRCYRRGRNGSVSAAP